MTASCTAEAVSITCCSDPSAPAHCASDPVTSLVGKAPASSTRTASHTACTCTGPVPTTVTPCAFRYPKPYRRPLTDPRP